MNDPSVKVLAEMVRLAWTQSFQHREDAEECYFGAEAALAALVARAEAAPREEPPTTSREDGIALAVKLARMHPGAGIDLFGVIKIETDGVSYVEIWQWPLDRIVPFAPVESLQHFILREPLIPNLLAEIAEEGK